MKFNALKTIVEVSDHHRLLSYYFIKIINWKMQNHKLENSVLYIINMYRTVNRGNKLGVCRAIHWEMQNYKLRKYKIINW